MYCPCEDRVSQTKALKVFEKRVLRRIFGPKGEGFAGVWR
jgi:hypothetical protein